MSLIHFCSDNIVGMLQNKAPFLRCLEHYDLRSCTYISSRRRAHPGDYKMVPLRQVCHVRCGNLFFVANDVLIKDSLRSRHRESLMLGQRTLIVPNIRSNPSSGHVRDRTFPPSAPCVLFSARACLPFSTARKGCAAPSRSAPGNPLGPRLPGRGHSGA